MNALLTIPNFYFFYICVFFSNEINGIKQLYWLFHFVKFMMPVLSTTLTYFPPIFLTSKQNIFHYWHGKCTCSCAKKSTRYFLRASAQHASSHQSEPELVHIMLLTFAPCSEVHTSALSYILSLCHIALYFVRMHAHTRTWKSTFQHARTSTMGKRQ